MNDPYTLLGVSRNADDAEIKKAYRALSKKYHPDNNPGDKAAEEHFKEIQAAYDRILEEKKRGYQSYGYGDGDPSGMSYGRADDGYSQSSQSADMRSAYIYLSNGYYHEALNVLNSMSERSAAWYYYSAVAYVNLGEREKALEMARNAVSMEPSNYAYSDLLTSLESGMSGSFFGSPFGFGPFGSVFGFGFGAPRRRSNEKPDSCITVIFRIAIIMLILYFMMRFQFMLFYYPGIY